MTTARYTLLGIVALLNAQPVGTAYAMRLVKATACLSQMPARTYASHSPKQKNILEKMKQTIKYYEFALEDQKQLDAQLLYETCKGSDLKTITSLLNDGADENAFDNNRMTPLHHAANTNSYDTVSELIKRGAKVQAANLDKKTPLHCALNSAAKCDSTRLKILHLLIKAGAEEEARTLKKRIEEVNEFHNYNLRNQPTNERYQ